MIKQFKQFLSGLFREPERRFELEQEVVNSPSTTCDKNDETCDKDEGTCEMNVSTEQCPDAKDEECSVGKEDGCQEKEIQCEMEKEDCPDSKTECELDKYKLPSKNDLMIMLNRDIRALAEEKGVLLGSRDNKLTMVTKIIAQLK